MSKEKPPKSKQPSDKAQRAAVESTVAESPIEAILKQLGTILIPGAVISAIGEALGAPRSQTAIATIAFVILIYVLIYRDHFRRLQSYIVIMLLVGLAGGAAFFRNDLANFWLSNTLSRATGIIECVPHANDFLPRLRKYIESAEHEIWFTGISFYVTLPQHRELLAKRVMDGVNVRFLVYDPRSPNFDEVATGFSQTADELRNECDITVAALKVMRDQCRQSNAKGTLEVRLFQTIPRTRLYVFDRQRDDGFTFFIPHVDQQNTPNLPAFLVKNIRTGVAPAYWDGIERLWNRSTTFDGWLAAAAAKQTASRPSASTQP